MSTLPPLPQGSAGPAPLRADFPTPPPTESKLRFIYMGGWGSAFAFTVVFLMSAGFVIATIFVAKREHDYRTIGRRAQAQIIDKRVHQRRESRGGTRTEYLATYRFTDDRGNTHETEDNVAERFFATLNVGDPHEVEYLGDDPDIHRLVLDRGNAVVWVLACFAATTTLGSAAAFLYVRRQANRRTRVVFTGQPLPGQVTLSELRGRGKYQRSVIGYRYMDPSGVERTPKHVNVSNKTMLRLPVGTIITVLIDPSDPNRPEPDLWGIRPSPAM